MSRRDEPAFPVVHGARSSGKDPIEVEFYPGLTKLEHTVIEMAQAAAPGFTNAESELTEKGAAGLAREASMMACAIWDHLEAVGSAEPEPPPEPPEPSESCEKCKKEGICSEHMPF